MNKDKLREISEETVKIFEDGYYIYANRKNIDLKEFNENTIKNTKLYKPQDGDLLVKNLVIEDKGVPVIEVTEETTLAAASRLIKEGFVNTSCLNFASAKNPGGGFLKGSRAQEESIARSSGLYGSLITKKEMYDYNIKNPGPFYSDYMIYSPKVAVIRDDKLRLIDEPYLLNVITSPSVNKGAIKRNEDYKKIDSVMLKRIEKIIAVAIENKNDTIVLGSFGCGVFKMEPKDVANYFYKVLVEKGYQKHFKKIVFAIYGGGDNYNEFKKVFK